jgi:hypothetical protein
MSTGAQVITEVAPTENGSAFGVTLVASTSTSLLAANAERERFTVTADVADIFLWYGAGPAQLSKGIRVKSGGAPYMEESWKGAVQVISTGAATVYGTEQNLAVGDPTFQSELPTGTSAYVPSGPSDGYGTRAVVTTGWKTGIKWPPNA